MLPRSNAPGEATIADPAISDQAFDIVLKPISHPELGDIRIDENLFAIGRNEAPFESYPAELVAELSRRHARIFCEDGAVHVVDLGSKNGTSVNGIDIRQKTSRLNDGDELGFGKSLTYRVQLGARAKHPGRTEKLVSLTLTPDHEELGVLPIVITQFPFLVSKADEAFARYRDKYPHQVNYLSRRHAHIFLKGGSPFVEDLGSTNGTFVAGKRLDEHAVRLGEGDVVAFGGHHFVYRVSIQKATVEADPTVTKLAGAARGAANVGDADKTTFVGAADSFLNIFCVDQGQPQEEEVNDAAAKQADEAAKDGAKGKLTGKYALLFSELSAAFLGGERKGSSHGLLRGAAVVMALGIAALALFFVGGGERSLKNLVDNGKYEQAADVANARLAKDRDDAHTKALGTEALLKAYVPQWLAAIKAGQFEHGSAVILDMKQHGSNNADAQPLVDELGWMGSLEQFVLSRGGPEAPIRIYADEDKIRELLRRWDDNTEGHQRAFTTIASYVPEFNERYADALSHLRKLKSDESVYLSAIERLKSTIATELSRDRANALEPVLKEYAEKYPRIGGLDKVRADLRQYTAIQDDIRGRKLGPLVALLQKANFTTPPFQSKFGDLKKSGVLPPAEVIQQTQEASRAWQAGDTQQAFAALQKITAVPWASAAAAELDRKKALLEQYNGLQKMRGTPDYETRLLAFYGSLDADEDAYFINATQQDIAALKEKALAQANDLLERSQTQWKQYRDNGGIQGTQRLESTVSNRFREQARALADARDYVQRGLQTYAQLKLPPSEQWTKLKDEIGAEAESQRKALEELRSVLEPPIYKAKLALLKGQANEERQSSKATH